MNKGAKKIKAKLNEIELNCMYIENIRITVKYVVSIEKLKNNDYSIYIISSSITRINNELELLKLINEINWISSFVTYVLERKYKIQAFSHLNTVLNLVNINTNIGNNYSKFMKSNLA